MKKQMLVACVLGLAVWFASYEASAQYGALAYNSLSGKSYISVNHHTAQQAQDRARSQCSGCKILTTFKNTCAAFAKGTLALKYGWATRSDLSEARSAALKGCKGLGCKVRVSSCSKTAPSAPTTRGKYGALAYNSLSGKSYISVGHQTAQQAQDRARSQCSGCKILTTFHNTCAAFAKGTLALKYGWATRSDLSEARSVALKGCKGLGCKVRVSSCAK